LCGRDGGSSGKKGEGLVNRATEKALKALAGHPIARVEIVADHAELAVPDSEGWRLVIGAVVDEQARPALSARWEPGLYRRHPRLLFRRLPAGGRPFKGARSHACGRHSKRPREEVITRAYTDAHNE
jgi:hypothetical protein